MMLTISLFRVAILDIRMPFSLFFLPFFSVITSINPFTTKMFSWDFLVFTEPTTRNCETCGSNMIPYPLSNGSKCGDPNSHVLHFECDTTTAQVWFKVPGGAYRVILASLTFEIQLKDAHCSSRSLNNKIPPLDSFPHD